MHAVNIVSMLVNAENALRCKKGWVRSLSYDELVKRPVDVANAIFDLMGLDKTRVTNGMIMAVMQKDSQENSTISRKSLQEKAHSNPPGDAKASAGESKGILSDAQTLEVTGMVQAFGVRGGIRGLSWLSAPLLDEGRSDESVLA